MTMELFQSLAVLMIWILCFRGQDTWLRSVVTNNRNTT